VLSQINDNGVISFGKGYNLSTPLPLPLSETDKIIAPYWADVDIREIGDIYYRQTTDPNLLARATSEIRAAFPASLNITISNLLIATWDRVGYYNNGIDKVIVLCMQEKIQVLTRAYVFPECHNKICILSFRVVWGALAFCVPLVLLLIHMLSLLINMTVFGKTMQSYCLCIYVPSSLIFNRFLLPTGPYLVLA